MEKINKTIIIKRDNELDFASDITDVYNSYSNIMSINTNTCVCLNGSSITREFYAFIVVGV